MNVHLGIHVVISLAVEDIYLHRTDPASEAAAILYMHLGIMKRKSSRREWGKRAQLQNQVRVTLYKIIEKAHPSPAQIQASYSS